MRAWPGGMGAYKVGGCEQSLLMHLDRSVLYGLMYVAIMHRGYYHKQKLPKKDTHKTCGFLVKTIT